MKKHVFGRQFNRDTNERKALFKGLINSLVMEESITTTLPKAKSIKGEVEKLITKAKNKGEASRSLLQPWLQAPALEKVLKDIAPRFSSRQGGYTRIIKLGERFGDNASMAVIEFVEKKEKVKIVEKDEKKPASVTANKEKVEAEAHSASSKKAEKSPVKKPAAKNTAKKTTKKEAAK